MASPTAVRIEVHCAGDIVEFGANGCSADHSLDCEVASLEMGCREMFHRTKAAIPGNLPRFGMSGTNLEQHDGFIKMVR